MKFKSRRNSPSPRHECSELLAQSANEDGNFASRPQRSNIINHIGKSVKSKSMGKRQSGQETGDNGNTSAQDTSKSENIIEPFNMPVNQGTKDNEIIDRPVLSDTFS